MALIKAKTVIKPIKGIYHHSIEPFPVAINTIWFVKDQCYYPGQEEEICNCDAYLQYAEVEDLINGEVELGHGHGADAYSIIEEICGAFNEAVQNSVVYDNYLSSEISFEEFQEQKNLPQEYDLKLPLKIYSALYQNDYSESDPLLIYKLLNTDSLSLLSETGNWCGVEDTTYELVESY